MFQHTRSVLALILCAAVAWPAAHAAAQAPPEDDWTRVPGMEWTIVARERAADRLRRDPRDAVRVAVPGRPMPEAVARAGQHDGRAMPIVGSGRP